MPETVTQALKRIGPSLTSDLIQEFVRSGMTDAAARKKISRAQWDYIRLAGIRFAKNARFIYLSDQYGTRGFWTALEAAFYTAGKSYWMTVVLLRGRGGICPVKHFPIVSGAPRARKGQLSPERILERLLKIQMLAEVSIDSDVPTHITFGSYELRRRGETELAAIQLAELVLLEAVKEWARRFGFGSFNKFALRTEDALPEVSGIAWDLAAPSYIRPLVQFADGRAKSGFFVADVNLNDVIPRDFVEAFVRKHDMASAPLKVGPIMPLLIGQGFTEEAFSLAKQKGILALTVENLFGSDVAKALKELIALLCDLGARASVDPAKIERVVTVLTKVEGAAKNVRASLFEVVVGSLVKNVEGGYLKVGEKLYGMDGRDAELDVQLDRSPEDGLLVIECKSKTPGARVGIGEVKKWYEDRVPLIFYLLSNNGSYAKKYVRFELWSNGPFNDDAVEWLRAQPLEFGSHSLGWKDGAAIKTYAAKSTESALRRILKDHYFNHPLSKVARETRQKRP